MGVIYGRSDNQETDAETAMTLARRAVELDPDFAQSHSALGFAHLALGQNEEAVRAARHASNLQPGDAFSHMFHAICLSVAGLGEEAVVEAETALQLDPQYIGGPHLNTLGRAYFVAERYEDAIRIYERNLVEGGPQHSGTMAIWAAAYAHTERLEKAKELVQDLLREEPGITFSDFLRSMSDSERARLKEGLRLAGLPE